MVPADRSSFFRFCPIFGAIALRTRFLSHSIPPRRFPVTESTSCCLSMLSDFSGDNSIQQISVVPPPISITNVVVGFSSERSTLYAAAIGSAKKLTWFKPCLFSGFAKYGHCLTITSFAPSTVKLHRSTNYCCIYCTVELMLCAFAKKNGVVWLSCQQTLVFDCLLN